MFTPLQLLSDFVTRPKQSLLAGIALFIIGCALFALKRYLSWFGSPLAPFVEGAVLAIVCMVVFVLVAHQLGRLPGRWQADNSAPDLIADSESAASNEGYSRISAVNFWLRCGGILLILDSLVDLLLHLSGVPTHRQTVFSGAALILVVAIDLFFLFILLGWFSRFYRVAAWQSFLALTIPFLISNVLYVYSTNSKVLARLFSS